MTQPETYSIFTVVLLLLLFYVAIYIVREHSYNNFSSSNLNIPLVFSSLTIGTALTYAVATQLVKFEAYPTWFMSLAVYAAMAFIGAGVGEIYQLYSHYTHIIVNYTLAKISNYLAIISVLFLSLTMVSLLLDSYFFGSPVRLAMTSLTTLVTSLLIFLLSPKVDLRP